MNSPRSRPGAASSPRGLGPDDPTRIGRYRIEAKIGEGGMGAVYLGRDPGGRPVAVKVVRAELAGDPTFLDRFQDEAANAQRVASFCTAQVLEHGADLGLAFMVTEYIDGPSLAQHVADEGALSPGMLHGVAVGVAAALVAIHSAGLVHRDLKPANVLLSISGPRVIDFGIARALDAASGHTRTGQVVGTPGWIAPEQITTQHVTPAVDLFAWGCLVAFAANGRSPFGQGSFQVLAARVVHAEPELGNLPGSLEGLVRACLNKDPAQRPSARDLLLALVGGGGEAAVNTTLGASWTPPPATGEHPLPQPPPATPPSHTPAPTAPSSNGPSSPTPASTGPRSNGPSSHAPAPTSPHSNGPAPTGPPSYRPAPAGPAPSGPLPQRPATAHPAPPPPTVAGPPPQQPTEPVHRAPAEHVPAGAPPAGPPARTPRRRVRPVAAAGLAVLLAGAAAGAYLLTRPDGEGKHHSSTAAAAFPTQPMYVRVDTAPGWPGKCHADIGVYRPGDAAPTTLVRDPKCDMLPVRSPDGARVAFTRTSPGSVPQAWVVNSDGSAPRMVSDKLAGGRVTWSPDGRRLAYVGRDGGTPQLYAVALADHTVTQLTSDGAPKDDPMWSRTGRLVFWSRRDGAEQLYTLDPDHPSAPWTRLSRDGVRSVDPAWSPDGSLIAYSRGPSSQSDIWLMKADGSGAHPLAASAEHEMDPAWSPDGHWVCYVRGAVGTPQIRAVRTDGTGDRPVTPNGQLLGHPNWS